MSSKRFATGFAFLVLAIVGTVAACGGGSTPAQTCTNGDTRACVGTGGCAGGQACSGGAWSSCDCGSAEAGVDGGTPDAAPDGADAGPDITLYLKNCPQVAGTAPMVEIPAQGGGSFCIDTREVTASEFDAQLNGYPTLSWQAPACSQGVEQPSYCVASNRNKGDLRSNCVSWCDAHASCKLVGKRLCTASEYASACLAKGLDYPWGVVKSEMDARCVPAKPQPASMSTCSPDVPPQSFVKDLAPILEGEWLAGVGQRGSPFKNAATLCESIATSSLIKAQSGSTRCCADHK